MDEFRKYSPDASNVPGGAVTRLFNGFCDGLGWNNPPLKKVETRHLELGGFLNADGDTP